MRYENYQASSDCSSPQSTLSVAIIRQDKHIKTCIKISNEDDPKKVEFIEELERKRCQ